MKDFLLELFLEHGDRAFGYRSDYMNDEYTRLFTLAREGMLIEYLNRPQYTAELLPYKLTAKALEYINSNDWKN